MENQEPEFVEVVIKDFTVPSLNGNVYNLDAPCTQLAIQKFIEKEHVYGELNHPYISTDKIPFIDPDTNSYNGNAVLKRISEIDLSNVAVHMTELRYDEEKKQIIGKIKPIPTIYKTLIEDLQQDKVRFGMRSLCYPYRTDGKDKLDIVDIVTFDIINSDIPEKK